LNYNNIFKFFVLVCFVVLFFSCRTKKINTIRKDIDLDEFKYELLKNNKVVNACVYQIDGISLNFKGTEYNALSGYLCFQKDSFLLLSISTILGIEVARVLVTKDSFKLLNRLEKTYYVVSLDTFQVKSGLFLELNEFGSLFTGDLALDKTDSLESIDWRSACINQEVVLTASHHKFKMKGYEYLKVGFNNFRIVNRVILDPLGHNKIIFDYKDFNSKGVAHKVCANIRFGVNTIKLDMTINSFKLLQKAENRFHIPVNYHFFPLGF
jgi:hypothetical protein